ncbi:hypothetical protein [Motilibacter aurantiacus]|uniref:hypothetical protein n=1 Tax=Motilibacter aurantiacus TaxID=2714955 RepID=UPI00140B4DE1|nr:hypothetical protein [Motilibacter aurantiacus]NHC43858.1 hypothetical protein [Motilibacter aurantiacus]
MDSALVFSGMALALVGAVLSSRPKRTLRRWGALSLCASTALIASSVVVLANG